MASWPPKRAIAFDLDVVIRDADGDPIADPAGLSAVLSKDGGAQAATTNAPAVVSAGSKIVKLTLTATEMTADRLAVVISSTSAGAKDAFISVYTSTRQVDDLATPAQVNAEVVDALNVDTYAEPGQEAPPATTTLVKKIGYLFKAFRNRKRQTATLWELLNDAETVVDQKATVSDDATTAIKQKIVSGP